MSRFKAIIFDFDGVISESLDVKTEAFAEMYRPYGKEIEEKVRKHHESNGGISRFEKFRIYQEDYLGKEVNDTIIDRLANKFSELVMDKVIHAPYVTDADTFIRNHHEDYDFFISTGTPEQEIKVILERKGLNTFFKEVHGSPEKKPEHVKGIMDRHGYKTSEVVFIGDAPTDIEAARINGITFIGRFTTSDLIKAEKHQIKDFSSFNEFLKTL
jgi:phosphoglycolate phosphatase-like HAD superfamily hydrolase